ncbi:MAG: hypothetical protein ACU0DK_04995 [Pseudooceanicola sp.]
MLPNIDEKWQESRETEILDMVKDLSEQDLCELARRLDRTTMTPKVLSWISAQRSLDLGTAMTLFINAEPERYNLMDKESVPEGYRKLCAALDALCQRINCGYYLPDPSRPLERTEEFSRWMKQQEAMDRTRRKGRWNFNPIVVAPMISDMRFTGKKRRGFGMSPPGTRRTSLFGRRSAAALSA